MTTKVKMFIEQARDIVLMYGHELEPLSTDRSTWFAPAPTRHLRHSSTRQSPRPAPITLWCD